MMLGSWIGRCKTWFEADVLADDSRIEGEFVSVIRKTIVRHVYTAALNNKPRQGEELIALNGISHCFEMTCIDDFHMNYGIMYSQDELLDDGFHATGSYDVADGRKRKWVTQYIFYDADHLTIVSYNIAPDGHKTKAIGIDYTRVS